MTQQTHNIQHDHKGSYPEGLGKVTPIRAPQARNRTESQAGKAEQMIDLMVERIRRNESRR